MRVLIVEDDPEVGRILPKPLALEWETTSADLSLRGIKVLRTGFTRPGRAGYVFYFENLSATLLDRLTREVRRLAAAPQPV